MGKLFDKGDSRAVSTESIGDIGLDEIRARQLIASADINPEILEELEDSAQGLSDATNVTEMAMEHLHVLESIKDGLTNNTLLSDRYLITLENFKPLAGRLGLKSLPAMEDFKNKYAAESAHTFALEGIGDVIRKFWQKIKDFFKSFFKRVMVFFKKLLKANLDLESYEKYTDQLIAKLNANKAVMGDNSPLYSKLPSYIANRNETKIDSDYVLRVGMAKIKNLLKSIDEMKVTHAKSIMSPTSLKVLVDEYTAFYNQNKGGISDLQDLKNSVKELLRTGKGLLISGFNFQVPDQKALPEEVFVALNDRLNGTQLKNAKMSVFSMSDMFSDFNSLPREANIFLAAMYDSGDLDNPKEFYVRGSVQDFSYVDGKINPIQNLSSLTALYKDYKNGIAKVDIKSFVKSVDDSATEIDKLITMVSRTVPELMEAVKIKSSLSGKTPSKMGDFIDQLQKLAKAQGHDKLTVLDTAIRASFSDPDITDIIDDEDAIVAMIVQATSGLDPNSQGLSKEKNIDPLNNANRQFQEAFIKKLMGMNFVKDLLASPSGSAEDAPLIRAELNTLNEFLRKILLNLQSIYKELGTLYYQQVTEIRYALIKYIYDSASRYTY